MEQEESNINAEYAKQSLFRFKQFAMLNCVDGLKIGSDGVLLGAWTDVNAAESIWDIGTGTGVIALMAAQRALPSCHITAFEIDPKAAAVAARNFAASPWHSRMKVIEGEALSVIAERSIIGVVPDIILSNPPYFAKSASLATRCAERDTARREGSLCFESLIKLGAKRLSPTGRLCFISPADRREDIEWHAAFYGLNIRHTTEVVTKEGRLPSRILWELSRLAGPLTTDKLVIRDSSGNYTKAYQLLTNDYYL